MTDATAANEPTAIARALATTDGPLAGVPDIDAKRAVIYLRVSSAGQLNTDRDAEGFSIPAQRDACLRKAESIDAFVVDEYVDKAESARTADRPQLKAMLERLRTEHDVDFVIVHKVDRLARNRADDVAINIAIREAGAQLVSVSEAIDESPSGTLLHGIMSSIAEFYSRNLATEITKGMNQKAKKGGLPGQAPVGYLNVRDFSDGKDIRTVEVDPERGPLLRWAFEAYASGDYSLLQLTEALADKGLTTRPTAKRPAKPLALNHVHRILTSRFYVGLVLWKSAEYPGRHEALVSIEIFATVQAILHSRNQAAEKMRKHPHYLKGTIVCARCGSRLSFTRSRGRHGVQYDYFYCLGRYRYHKECDLPHVPVDEVEDAILEYYRTIELGADTVTEIRDRVLAAIRATTQGVEQEAGKQRKRIKALETKRRKLLQAHLADAVPVELLREEQDRITRQLADAGAALANTEIHWETIEDNVAVALGLANRFHDAYRRADKTTRRHLNQAVFEAVYVDIACVRTRAQFALLSIANAYIVRPDDECHRLEHKAEETRRALRGTVSTIKSRTTPNRTTRRGVASLRARA